jgi:hypothetical protein
VLGIRISLARGSTVVIFPHSHRYISTKNLAKFAFPQTQVISLEYEDVMYVKPSCTLLEDEKLE